MQKILSFLLIGFAVSLLSCEKSKEKPNWKNSPWESISAAADSTTVNFMMWQGSPANNAYINDYVKPELKKRYNIDLQVSGGQGPEIVQLLMGEKQAASTEGQVDIVWINGETFFQLKKIEALWGPFVDQLPHSKYIDFNDPFINTDFQQPIEGMECPWGISQFALIYDTTRIKNPPKTLPELERFVKDNPGTFTISNDFSGMSLLKCFLAELSGSPTGLDGPFDQQKYDSLSAQLWTFINKNKKYFWKEGRTFPKEHSRMDQMFASGELKLSYGFGEGGIEDKVLQGLYPKTTHGYAWENGTVLNSNYLGITYNSTNIPGAMQVINFLISPEAQYRKGDPKGTNANSVLEISQLPEKWQGKFKEIKERKYGPKLEVLQENAIKEPAPEYMLNIYEDFRTYVIED